jgi:hypothetical protein
MRCSNIEGNLNETTLEERYNLLSKEKVITER